jgi:hypothetical protein
MSLSPMTTTVLVVMAGVFLVLYMMRRRNRLNKQD